MKDYAIYLGGRRLAALALKGLSQMYFLCRNSQSK